MSATSPYIKEKTDHLAESFWMKTLFLMLKDLHYGSVTLVIQDGKVIQFDKTEKVRL